MSISIPFHDSAGEWTASATLVLGNFAIKDGFQRVAEEILNDVRQVPLGTRSAYSSFFGQIEHLQPPCASGRWLFLADVQLD